MTDEDKLKPDEWPNSKPNTSVESDTPKNEDTAGPSKKKKSKRKRIKAAFTPGVDTSQPGSASEIVGRNASLDPELGKRSIEDLLKQMSVQELLTGMSATAGAKKDMASYKFWQTQPVSRFDEKINEEGPIEAAQPLELVPKTPIPLLKDFEWVTIDLEDKEQLNEVHILLSENYVEDIDSAFRFNYSASFLDWALKSPAWKQDWHIGVRVATSRKLVAFISGIPVSLRVRATTLACSEINFLCVHKKLRSKRLAPVLIKEVTRRCHVHGIWQALYSAGVVLPKPITTARYFHRCLNWAKLYDVGFSALPPNSTKSKQIERFKLPSEPSLKLREMRAEDIEDVAELLQKYLSRFDMAPQYSEEEVTHWFSHRVSDQDRVVWSYVVEDDESNDITDFVSFYSLPSTVIGNKSHRSINIAYLFYYATQTAFEEGPNSKKLQTRLRTLINDAMIMAVKYKFDVFNALSILDNHLFLEELKFGPGDGYLNYYLYNYRALPIRAGTDEKGKIDKKDGSGMGLVML